MAVIRVPNTLRGLTGGAAEVVVEGSELGAAVAALDVAHPGIGERIIDENARIYGFVNVFVGDQECRTLDGLQTPLDADTVVSIVPAVAGG